MTINGVGKAARRDVNSRSRSVAIVCASTWWFCLPWSSLQYLVTGRHQLQSWRKEKKAVAVLVPSEQLEYVVSVDLKRPALSEAMASHAKRLTVLSLYRQLLRESNQFSNYNFRWVSPIAVNVFFFSFFFLLCVCVYLKVVLVQRNYFTRRIRDAFRQELDLSNEASIDKCIAKSQEQLAMIKRQVSDASTKFALHTSSDKLRDVW